MPYIPKDRRISCPTSGFPYNPGELNFAITKLMDTYIQEKGLSYRTLNDIVGALEGAKLEFYRRIAAPYENEKIIQNGDVYSCISRKENK